MKPCAEVRKKTRFDFYEIENLDPKVTNPHEIDDVVFQIGINDFRRGLTGDEFIHKYTEMLMKYKKLFPNARQHVTAIPPLSNDHEKVNKGLQKLSSHRGCNFISLKSFFDRATGKLRANLIEGYHYNAVGVRHLSKEIKKSLFSTSNRESHPSSLHYGRNMSDKNPQEEDYSTLLEMEMLR